MAYKRALWKSGLTYRQTCRSCGLDITYMDNILDFRPWFPDGFIYCPRCKTPLRHNEILAVNRPMEANSINLSPDTSPIHPDDAPAVAKFCSECGTEFRDGANFCVNCGTKRK